MVSLTEESLATAYQRCFTGRMPFLSPKPTVSKHQMIIFHNDMWQTYSPRDNVARVDESRGSRPAQQCLCICSSVAK